MAESTADLSCNAGDLRRQVKECWRAKKIAEAFELAWLAFDRFKGDRETKALLAKLIEQQPDALLPERRADYGKLLGDPDVEPDLITRAGWCAVLQSHPVDDPASETALAALAADISRDDLALQLLREAPVGLAQAERLVTWLRRWLLLARQWDRYPALVAALAAQARLNEGAWPFDEAERAQLADAACAPMRAAYLPDRHGDPTAAVQAADPVTRAVTAQYEGWPYPAWTRLTRRAPTTLPAAVRKMDPAAAEGLPVQADMLVAGCGTGRHAAAVALRYPGAIVTAIDVSTASLDYARRQCAALGIANVRFQKLDLHDIGELGQRFHAIHCGGVLHHLPSPERGWRALVDVLAPNGVMRIMVYNKMARLRIAGARALIADLVREPVTDDLLREVRRRILERLDHPLAAYVARSRDFATLARTYDLLLHQHEDSFDLPRIKRCLDDLGLRLLSFDLPTPPVEAAYVAVFPHDSGRQDMASWIRFEKENFGQLTGNYHFWCCRKPSAAA